MRVNRGMRLTEAGRLLVEGAQGIFSEIERVRDMVAAHEAAPRGTVIVGITPTLCPVVLPELVARMEAYPKIELKIEQRGSPMLPERLLAGSIDLAVMADMTRSRLLERANVAQEEMVLVTSGSQQRDNIIEWGELVRVPLVLTQTIQIIMKRLTISRNQELKVSMVMNSLEALRVLVQEGRCATILPYSFARREYKMGLFGIRRIKDENMKRQLIVARSKGRQTTLAVEQVSNLCKQIFFDLDRNGYFTIK